MPWLTAVAQAMLQGACYEEPVFLPLSSAVLGQWCRRFLHNAHGTAAYGLAGLECIEEVGVQMSLCKSPGLLPLLGVFALGTSGGPDDSPLLLSPKEFFSEHFRQEASEMPPGPRPLGLLGGDESEEGSLYTNARFGVPLGPKWSGVRLCRDGLPRGLELEGGRSRNASGPNGSGGHMEPLMLDTSDGHRDPLGLDICGGRSDPRGLNAADGLKDLLGLEVVDGLKDRRGLEVSGGHKDRLGLEALAGVDDLPPLEACDGHKESRYRLLL